MGPETKDSRPSGGAVQLPIKSPSAITSVQRERNRDDATIVHPPACMGDDAKSMLLGLAPYNERSPPAKS